MKGTTAAAEKDVPTGNDPQASTSEVVYRPIKTDDLPQVKQLHEECFPIRYDEGFYRAMVSPSCFMSQVAVTREGAVVGVLVASMEAENQHEDCDMLQFEWNWTTRYLIYILTIGVTARYRRHGIARVLLGELLQKASRYEQCKAIYLHVLTTNVPAIRFYEQNGFMRLRYLPEYYSFEGGRHDAFLYVFYQHDGRPPRTWTELKDDLLRPIRRRAPPLLMPLLSSSPSSSASPFINRVLRSPATILCLILLPLLFLLLCIYISRS